MVPLAPNTNSIGSSISAQLSRDQQTDKPQVCSNVLHLCNAAYKCLILHHILKNKKKILKKYFHYKTITQLLQTD